MLVVVVVDGDRKWSGNYKPAAKVKKRNDIDGRVHCHRACGGRHTRKWPHRLRSLVVASLCVCGFLWANFKPNNVE